MGVLCTLSYSETLAGFVCVVHRLLKAKMQSLAIEPRRPSLQVAGCRLI